MGKTILLRRGTLANLPSLQEGEPGWSTDSEMLFIGKGTAYPKAANSPYVTYPQEYGAVGDGVTDDTTAVSAAITANGGTTIIDGGTFLVTSQITIADDGKKISFGPTGSIVRGTGVAANAVFYATGKDNLIFENPRMTVEATETTTGTVGADFINLYRCNNVTFINPDLNGLNGASSETLWAAIATPDCNDVLIINPNIRNIYGQGCGAQNTTGAAGYAERFTTVGGSITNVVDTGLGMWTGAKTIRVIGTKFVRDNYTNYPDYSGVGIDVAGATDVDIQGDFDGNTIGVRVLNNLGYNINNVRIHHCSSKNHIGNATEYGIFVKMAMYGTDDDDMDVSITDNDINVNGTGALGVVGVVITNTNAGTGVLKPTIDRNRFIVNTASDGYGIAEENDATDGNRVLIPGTNTFILSGTGVAVKAPTFSITAGETIVSERAVPFFSVPAKVLTANASLGMVYLPIGLYFTTYSFSSMDDDGVPTQHYIDITTKAGASVARIFTDDVNADSYINGPNAALTSPWWRVTTAGVYEVAFVTLSGSPNIELDFVNIYKIY